MKTRKCKKQNEAVIKPAPRTVAEWWWMPPHNEKLLALLIAQLVEELTEQNHLEIRMTGGRIKVAWSGLTNVGTMAAEVIPSRNRMLSAALRARIAMGCPWTAGTVLDFGAPQSRPGPWPVFYSPNS